MIIKLETSTNQLKLEVEKMREEQEAKALEWSQTLSEEKTLCHSVKMQLQAISVKVRVPT